MKEFKYFLMTAVILLSACTTTKPPELPKAQGEIVRVNSNESIQYIKSLQNDYR